LIARAPSRVVPAALTLLLAGCGPSVEGYVDDLEERREILAKCAMLELNPTEDQRCAMAVEAEAVAAKQAVEGLFEDG
jgi:hypothetical protein